MAAAVIVLASLLKEFIQGFTANAVKVFRRLFLWRQNGSGDKEKCPFEVLGLKGGKENSTMEEAVKARRKLALKWHPDRNLGNEAAATKKMQEINDSFNKVEKILLTGNGQVGDGGSECPDADSDNEERTDAQKKEYEKRQQQRQHDEAREFERKMREECANFTKAQMKAEMSKSAKKRKARQRKARQRKARQRSNPQCQHVNESSKNDNESKNPFQHLSPEIRCEIKFKSEVLPRHPIFTAIRTQSYQVLHMLLTGMEGRCKPINLPNEGEIFVTPLHLASYLSDFVAVEIIIQNLGKNWAEAALSTTLPGGDDCVALATEGRDFINYRYEESKANLANSKSRKDKDAQAKLVEEYAKSLAAAEKLVVRLSDMKKLALDKKRKDNMHLFGFATATLIAAVLWYHYIGFVRSFLLLFTGLVLAYHIGFVRSFYLLFKLCLPIAALLLVFEGVSSLWSLVSS